MLNIVLHSISDYKGKTSAFRIIEITKNICPKFDLKSELPQIFKQKKKIILIKIVKILSLNLVILSLKIYNKPLNLYL